MQETPDYNVHVCVCISEELHYLHGFPVQKLLYSCRAQIHSFWAITVLKHNANNSAILAKSNSQLFLRQASFA